MKKRDKRGISIMIGYVLLISAMIVMWFIVYQWLRTYVPTEKLECPQEVSLIIGEVTCNLNENKLTIKEIKNNGLFSVNGFILKGNVQIEQDGANIDKGVKDLGEYYFKMENGLEPDDEALDIVFDWPNDNGNQYQITSIEVTPIRIQQNEKGKDVNVICSESIIKKDISSANCVIKLKE